MAIVCHGCGEPLHTNGQFCSDCGQRRGDRPRAGRAVRSRVWLSVLGLAAVAPLLLQCYWRQQASAWMEAGNHLKLLAAQPPPEPGIRSTPRNEAMARSRSAARPAETLRRRPARRPGAAGDRPRLALASVARPGSGPDAKETRLSLSVVPQNVTTFVYLNGGTLLGRAPLRETPVRPGRHRLVLWAPAIRGRAICSVILAPGKHTRVSTEIEAGAPS